VTIISTTIARPLPGEHKQTWKLNYFIPFSCKDLYTQSVNLFCIIADMKTEPSFRAVNLAFRNTEFTFKFPHFMTSSTVKQRTERNWLWTLKCAISLRWTWLRRFSRMCACMCLCAFVCLLFQNCLELPHPKRYIQPCMLKWNMMFAHKMIRIRKALRREGEAVIKQMLTLLLG